MNVIPDFKASTIIPVLPRNVAPGSTIYTDGLKSFAGLVEAGFKPVVRIQPLRSELRKGAKSAVPLADRALGNLQQWLIGTYHGVSKAPLQVYLDEFVFLHNRRKTWQAVCWPSSYIPQLPAIRWYWLVLLWLCHCWGYWLRGFWRGARCQLIL
jgi:transposase-like protein